MKKIFKPIPVFKNEDEERQFWAENDSSEYIDWDQAKKMKLANLKRSDSTISLRLPSSLLNQVKVKAHKIGVPYQSLIKTWIAQNA